MTRLDDNHVGDYGIVERVGVFSDIKIFWTLRFTSARKGR
jgi:hypothetical protein